MARGGELRRALRRLERVAPERRETLWDRLRRTLGGRRRETAIERLQRSLRELSREVRTLERELRRARSRARAERFRFIARELRSAASALERAARRARELERLEGQLRRARALRARGGLITALLTRGRVERLEIEAERRAAEVAQEVARAAEALERAGYGSEAASAAAGELRAMERKDVVRIAHQIGLQTKGKRKEEIVEEIVSLFDAVMMDAPPRGAEFRAAFATFEEAIDYASTIPVPTFIVYNSSSGEWEVWVEDVS